jgi:transposase InsO family protein
VLIRAAHEASGCRYGSPRVHEDLIEQGIPVSRKRVVRLMQAEGLNAPVRKRFKGATMSDHLAAVLDLYSRFLVGWAVSAINDRHLVIKALQMALKRRRPATLGPCRLRRPWR